MHNHEIVKYFIRKHNTIYSIRLINTGTEYKEINNRHDTRSQSIKLQYMSRLIDWLNRFYIPPSSFFKLKHTEI